MPRYRGRAIAMGAVIGLAVLLLVPGTSGLSRDSASGGLLLRAASAPCPGLLLAHNYTGSVEWNGADAGSSVPLAFSYYAAITTNRSDGVVLSSVCAVRNGTVTPDGSGAFSFSIDASANTSCTFPGGGQAGTCVTAEGPYEVVNVTLLEPAPPGYTDSVAQNGTEFAVDVYSELANVVLASESGSSTFSPGAADGMRAVPMTGADTPSPVAPVFSWTLAGTGWSFVGPHAGAWVNVTAAPGAGIANLSVVAQLDVSGGTLVTPITGISLEERATGIASASLNRTAVDAGEPVGVSAIASGAEGYPYTATVAPGLGVAPSSVPCTSSEVSGDGVALDCSATFEYAATGAAQPTLTVTNGDSSATWEFPEVTVNPAPAIEFVPGAPVGYVGAALPIELVAGAGTGTAPYERACLAPGTGSVLCEDSPGPAWTFHPSFPAPGVFGVRGWIVDATGTNRSATVSVRVDPPLAVAFAPTPLAVSAGTPLSVGAVLSGGDLPAALWWNASGPSGTITSGTAAVDGPVSALFDPAHVGFETLTVTAVDRLGTSASASLTFEVGPGAAVEVVRLGPPVPTNVVAGAPVGLEWQALDAGGNAVPTFTSLAEIELARPGGGDAATGWVNASGYGPLPDPVPGWFNVPAAAWAAGALNVSVSVRAAGAVEVELSLENGFSTAHDSVPLAVAPDLDRLLLFDPARAAANGGTNDTLWQVSDRFGNPAPSAAVLTTATFGGRVSESLSTAFVEPGGASAVWVNYTVPAGVGGTVTVTDLAGQALVPTVTIPAPYALGAAVLAALPFALLAGLGAVLGVLAWRSRRPGTSREVDEARALQRLAEGRARVVEVVRRDGPIDLAGIATVWGASPPGELADWLASLLTDGTIDARFADDGSARFVLASGTDPGTRITVDLDAFERGQEARDSARADWGADEE
jgi:hypothetical protein